MNYEYTTYCCGFIQEKFSNMLKGIYYVRSIKESSDLFHSKGSVKQANLFFFFLLKMCRVLMAPELRRCWKQFILQLIKTLFLEMCLPWFLVASGWVQALCCFYYNFYVLIHLHDFSCGIQEPLLLLLEDLLRRILLRQQSSLMQQ